MGHIAHRFECQGVALFERMRRCGLVRESLSFGVGSEVSESLV